jgi:hypothetical protein
MKEKEFSEGVQCTIREVIKCKLKKLVRYQKYARSIFVRQLKVQTVRS